MSTEQPADKPQQNPVPQKATPQRPTGLVIPAGVGFPGFPQGFNPFQPTQALYANGFEMNVTGADVMVTFSQNGRILMTLNLSFTTAKAMGRGLVDLVQNLEDKSHTKILFADEIEKALESSSGG
jgi:hypothetical protein